MKKKLPLAIASMAIIIKAKSTMRISNNILLFLVLLSVSCSDDEVSETMESELFYRTENPVYESPFGLAADPSVLRANDTLLMYYSAEGGIGVTFSLDNGLNWDRPDNSDQDYLALTRQANHWDNTLETVEVIKVENEYKMYYAGYREGEADNPHVENYEIGLATSQNGIDFARIPQSINQPILTRDTSDENTFDRHAMTSPGIVYENGEYYMIYAGWNVTNDWTGANAGIRILGATSTDGINWEKVEEPLLIASDVYYSPDVNEASLLKAEDGIWYIPFSTDKSIGIARSNSFLGNYEIFPETIIWPQFNWDNEVTAPDGIIEDGKMRIWFHGVKEPNYWPWVIGYTEAEYPLNWN